MYPRQGDGNKLMVIRDFNNFPQLASDGSARPDREFIAGFLVLIQRLNHRAYHQFYASSSFNYIVFVLSAMHFHRVCHISLGFFSVEYIIFFNSFLLC